MNFIVTSTNKVKTQAVEATLQKILSDPSLRYSVEGCSANSDVSDQPKSLEETKRGAINRIFNCNVSDADYYISIESGVEREYDNTYSFTFAAICDHTKNRFGFGLSTKFIVPDDNANKIQSGSSLGSIVHNPNGLISELTNDLIRRSDLISEAVISALIPFHFTSTSLPENSPPELTRFYNSLNQIEKGSLTSQIRNLDLIPPKTVDVKSITSDIEPLSLPDPCDDEERNDIFENGITALSDGEVAVVIMAGGQGSRLAAPVPKALMELDIPSHSTLLSLQLRRIYRLEKKYCDNGSSIPTYILTSDSTHSAISSYLIRNQYFGVKSIKLIKQPTLPARFPENNGFVLSEKGKVLVAPNGNGSVFSCLKESGALAEMIQKGVKYVDIHPIDNALARPADPFFVGSLIYEEGDAALKVVRKVGGGEKIGTLCKNKKTGKTVVVEYSELPKDAPPNTFMVGNTGLHLFTTDIIQKVADAQLPYHIAVKNEKVVVNDNGDRDMAVVHKFERFIFDAFNYCDNVVLVEADRNDEFAPVKNAPGAPVDSPDTAKELLLQLHKKWAILNGMKFQGKDAVIEFKPETTYSGEDLQNLDLRGKVISSPTII